jgi:glycosyltransferase involved in cell wall biosynthesis
MELILVDDGSTDASLQIMRNYGDRIHLIHQDRAGPAAARNRGIRAAQGDYLAFHDADDVWMPGKLEAQIRFMLERPEFQIVFGQFAFWNPDEYKRYPDPTLFLDRPETWEVKEPLSGSIYVDELMDSCIAMITPVVRREVFETIGGFDETLLGGSDYDFWLRATHRFRAHKMPQCFAAYRLQTKGVTGTPKAINFPFVVLKRAVDTFGLTGPDGRNASAQAVNQRLADTWLNFALLHIDRGSRRIALHALAKYVQYAPRRWHACLRYGRSLVHMVQRSLQF